MLHIHHHLGLGDHIICNGMVRSLLEREGEVTVFVKERNHDCVKRMYDDTNNIHLYPLPDGKDECAAVDRIVKSSNVRLLRVGFDQLFAVPNMNFDEVFYIYAGVPFEKRWSKFHVRRDKECESRVLAKLNPHHERYMFVHDDPARGYHLNPPNPHNLKVIKNDPSEDIFSMIGVLENAAEIHCMESSFKCLIENISSVKCNLYFHRQVRSPTQPYVSSSKRQWIEFN